MTFDAKSPAQMLPPSLRFMCRVLGLMCLGGYCLAAGAVVLAIIAGIYAMVVQDGDLPQGASLALIAVPASGLVFGLFNADRLFAALRRGEYFAAGTARALQNFSLGMAAYLLTPWLIVMPILALLGKVQITPPDDLSLRIGDYSQDWLQTLVMLIFLGAIVLFARVWRSAALMAERAELLAQENAQFV